MCPEDSLLVGRFEADDLDEYTILVEQQHEAVGLLLVHTDDAKHVAMRTLADALVGGLHAFSDGDDVVGNLLRLQGEHRRCNAGQDQEQGDEEQTEVERHDVFLSRAFTQLMT